MRIEKLINLRKQFKRKKQKVGLVHGVFDVLHSGHIDHLREAKMYCDKLLLENGEYDYHIRMKGVSKNCILAKGEVMDVYKRLYKGEEISFNLCLNNVMFRFEKGFGVTKLNTFIRKIKIC